MRKLTLVLMVLSGFAFGDLDRSVNFLSKDEHKRFDDILRRARLLCPEMMEALEEDGIFIAHRYVYAPKEDLTRIYEYKRFERGKPVGLFSVKGKMGKMIKRTNLVLCTYEEFGR